MNKLSFEEWLTHSDDVQRLAVQSQWICHEISPTLRKRKYEYRSSSMHWTLTPEYRYESRFDLRISKLEDDGKDEGVAFEVNIESGEFYNLLSLLSQYRDVDLAVRDQDFRALVNDLLSVSAPLLCLASTEGDWVEVEADQ